MKVAQNNELPEDLVDLLLRAGISQQAIRKATFNTRVYHDLGLYGDTAWWFIEELSGLIDMENFQFDRYFPPEFYGSTAIGRIVNAMVPFANWIRRRNSKFAPLTLELVTKNLKSGFWQD